jgi:hypothetical protein
MWHRKAGVKYNNTWSEAFGHKFQSKWERDRFLINLSRQEAGEISGLRLQVTYHLDVNGVHICDYRADFVYQENGVTIVEDAKGMITAEYAIKKKLMRACHGITIREMHRKPKRTRKEIQAAMI